MLRIGQSGWILLLSFMLVTPLHTESSQTYLNRILSSAEENADKSLNRLSGGTRLLPDDPANYAIYEKLEAHIRHLEKTITNQTDMISYYQTIDGYLSHITELLQHIRELLVKKSGFLYTGESGDYIGTEVDLYYNDILSTLKRAEFNKNKIFDTLIEDETIKERFKDEVFYKISNIDRLLSFFTEQRSFYGALVRSLEDRNKGLASDTVELEGFQGTVWDINVEQEVNRYIRHHLLFLVNLLLL